ncbi:MAG: phospholipase [Actinobacteria bacterium 13_2_20CM_2_71_6]|nr:MAG: phospholipase [Actinobacteria bacterium 13_2_20CM_2_71_6]
MRRLLSAFALTLTTVLAALAAATPAHAATLDQKLAVLSSFSQATAPSQAAWAWGRANPGAYAGYGLDWSTDYCSDSPDQPLGFDFRLPCARHDFGYRNYKEVGLFPANKDRVDSAFYFDLLAKCARYSWVVRPSCDSLAWTYYEAVHLFGALAVSRADLDRAAAYKAALERRR